MGNDDGSRMVEAGLRDIRIETIDATLGTATGLTTGTGSPPATRWAGHWLPVCGL